VYSINGLPWPPRFRKRRQGDAVSFNSLPSPVRNLVLRGRQSLCEVKVAVNIIQKQFELYRLRQERQHILELYRTVYRNMWREAEEDNWAWHDLVETVAWIEAERDEAKKVYDTVILKYEDSITND